MKITESIKLATKGFKPADIKQIEDAGINTDDIIKLAESGYSPSDVSELITLAQEKEEDVQPKTKAEEVPEASAGTGDQGSENDDLIKEIESKDEEIKNLKSTISKIQSGNASRNLGGSDEKSNREKVQEAFATLY